MEAAIVGQLFSLLPFITFCPTKILAAQEIRRDSQNIKEKTLSAEYYNNVEECKQTASSVVWVIEPRGLCLKQPVLGSSL